MKSEKSTRCTFIKLCDKFVSILAGGLLLFFFFGLIIYKITMVSVLETKIYHRNNMLYLLGLFFFIALIFKLGQRFSKLSLKKGIIVSIFVWVLLGIVLLAVSKKLPLRSDQKNVFNSAIKIKNGDFSPLKAGGYLGKYPGQLGLVSFELLLSYVNENPLFFYVIWNLLSIIQLMLQIINARSLSMNNTINIYSMMIGTLFFPGLFLLLLIYGDIPGLTMILLASCFFLRALQNGEKRFALTGLAFSLLSCTFRQNYLISIIALSITIILHSITKRNILIFLLAIVLLVTCTLVDPGIKEIYKAFCNADYSGRQPTLRWIMLGLTESPRGNGQWRNDYNPLQEAGQWDSKKTAEIIKKDLQERISFFLQDFVYTIRFFSKKIMETWCEPTFGSLAHTISRSNNVISLFAESPLLYSLASEEGWLHKTYEAICFLSVAMIYLFAFLNLLLRRDHYGSTTYYAELFPYINLIGFFVFELFWETRSRYVFPAVSMLIPVSALGMQRFAKIFKNKI